MMNGKQKQNMIKILHVDDEPDFLKLTKDILETGNKKFSVETVTSVEEGLELLRSGKYDVVISDYKMHGLDGLRFLQNLRQSGSQIPFIIFTGKGREEVAIEALNRGANYYLQKGGDIKSLYGTLAHAIKEVVEQRVCSNIIGNAISIMPEGGSLGIRTETNKEEGNVEISFSDTGEGIAKENMEKIFEPLFTTRAKGIGLGLALCKKYVEAHQGTIEVESEVGKGSKFVVKLPVSE